ncbi:putative dynein intermediate chain [Trypanosoma grayi]|uniref:putative dynein intermediate chain n=1 Tax=Trypanosoma grayi TaxID=71804 RepID=UPI0004F41B8B|nr:putative dynein intermediate chain [Trypanosoma grayi]KEG12739.1 putative dynein intermediate chain [Trypanosoma grayi]
MDLAEKRRQLEEIRAAREAKQRSVQQQFQQGTAGTLFPSASSSNNPKPLSPTLSLPVGTDALRSSSSTASSVNVREERRACEVRIPTTRLSPVPARFPRQSPEHSSVGKSGAGDNVRKTQGVTGGGRKGSGTWNVEAGVGAIALEPTEYDAAVVGAPSLGATTTYVTEKALEEESEGRRRAVSPPDTAMLLAHSLRAETLFNWKGRSVLDVTMLGSHALDSGVHDADDCLLVAAALSEDGHAEENTDGATRSSAVRVGETLLPSRAQGLVLLCCVGRGRADDSCYSVVPLYFDSEIRVLTYTRYSPHLLFGGAANGCVVAWRIDHALQERRGTSVRRVVQQPVSFSLPSLMAPTVCSAAAAAAAASVAPSDQSFPSPHAHHSRVLGMAVHGDANYHHLYSVSQDGRVCMWAPLQLRLPSSSRDGVTSGQPLGCVGSCAAFVDKAADAMSKVVFGCLDGHVLEGRTKSSRTVEMRPITTSTSSLSTPPPSPRLTSTGVAGASEAPSMLLHRSRTTTAVAGGGTAAAAHHSAVVAVAPHPLHADPRISDMVLTAATDGSCSLWLGARHIAIDGFGAQVNCLRWSPTHPAVFVAGENNGRVAAWDLTQSSYSPVVFVYLRSMRAASGWARSSSAGTAAAAPPHRSAAVTSLSFSEDGVWLACGTAAGDVHLLQMRADLVTEAKDAGQRSEKADDEGCATSAAAAAFVSSGNYNTASWIDARFVC